MQPIGQSTVAPKPLIIRTYKVQTETSTRVREQVIRNSITATLRQTEYGSVDNDSHTVLVEQLDFRQSDRSPLAVLLNDLNSLNERLVFDLSIYGDLQRLRNQSQVIERWHRLKPQLMATYGRSAEGVAFLQGFEQQLMGESLLNNFRHKGAYGVLLPGLFATNGLVREGPSQRTITNFFGSLDLPLLLQTTVTPSTTPAGGRTVEVLVGPNPARFDEDKLRALAQEIMDQLNVETVHHIEGKESYTLAADHTLVAARQTLSAVIEGVYHHYTQHTLTLLPTHG